MEMDSTGSILSDLNCLSKSEDDLTDTNGIFSQSQKHGESKEHGGATTCENSAQHKQHNTLDKVAEFNSLDRATTSVTVKSSNGTTYAASFLQIQATPASNEDANEPKPKLSEANHSFVTKMVIKPETCTHCGKR